MKLKSRPTPRIGRASRSPGTSATTPTPSPRYWPTSVAVVPLSYFPRNHHNLNALATGHDTECLALLTRLLELLDDPVSLLTGGEHIMARRHDLLNKRFPHTHLLRSGLRKHTPHNLSTTSPLSPVSIVRRKFFSNFSLIAFVNSFILFSPYCSL